MLSRHTFLHRLHHVSDFSISFHPSVDPTHLLKSLPAPLLPLSEHHALSRQPALMALLPRAALKLQLSTFGLVASVGSDSRGERVLPFSGFSSFSGGGLGMRDFHNQRKTAHPLMSSNITINLTSS